MTDIQTIRLSEYVSILENATRFFDEIGDPYTFKVDDMIVNVRFNKENPIPLQKCVENILMRRVI